MGLNDLTLEKLIGEINGYKEKMHSLYEDYGRAAQDLQDRINVLGYTLNEHLKETRDQISNTPQRLLNLETKYVTGEVSEQDYRTQREEFKALLQRNLRSIEEIRSMITVLSQLETRPLAPSEYKQSTVTSRASPLTGEEWGRGVFIQDKPKPPIVPQSLPAQSQNPTQSGLRFASEPPGPEKTIQVETAPQKSSPSPPQPNTRDSDWSAPQPTTSQPPTTTTAGFSPPPSMMAEPSNVPPAMAQEASIGEGQPFTGQPSTIGTAKESVPTELGSSSPDDSMATVSSADVVEETALDDALVVKVVDDIASVEAATSASTSAVSGEAPQLQAPTRVGSETVTGVQPEADLAQVSLTPPTPFYKVVCPKCGADVPRPAKVWELKGGKSKKNVLIGLFQCQDCRVKFREALTREII